MNAPALTAISCGAGRQTTAISLLAVEGLPPRPDVAIFADTGWEWLKANQANQYDLFEATGIDLFGGELEDGDPDGCSPHGCRSGSAGGAS